MTLAAVALRRRFSRKGSLIGKAKTFLSGMSQIVDRRNFLLIVVDDMGFSDLGALVLGVLAMIFFMLADRLFPIVCGLLRVEYGTIADPAALPVLVIIVATVRLFATPITTTVSRLQESDADRPSLEFTDEPDGCPGAGQDDRVSRLLTKPGRGSHIL